jgi:hypothetical protein
MMITMQTGKVNSVADKHQTKLSIKTRTAGRQQRTQINTRAEQMTSKNK